MRGLVTAPAPIPGLNPRQSAAVRHLDGPLLVLAGAGSGKTRVITQKIAYLIRDCGIAASHVAAVTFTNKAAREMKARVGQLLGKQDLRGLRVSTFHSLGLAIVRAEVERLGLKPGFSLFDPDDAVALLQDLGKGERGPDNGAAQAAQARISAWKNDGLTPAQAVAACEDESALRDAMLYGEYERHLRAYNAADLDDLILLPVRLLREHDEVRERWQNRIRHLLVDEYQDTNGSQYELVRLLCGVRGALTVVGDDDQSIYAWRGARPENLARLQQDFPGLTVIKLEQNYRSMGRILRAANQLIANNPHVFEKRLWSDLGQGEPIRVLSCADEEAEAQQVVAEIVHHQFTHRSRHGDYAILYRGNHQARLFEKALRDHRVPYYLSGGTSFFERGEIKDLMAYLRVLTNPDDDAAFLRIVNTPRREIGPTTLEKLGDYAKARGLSLFAASFEIGLEQTLSGRPLERLRAFTRWLTEIGDRAVRGDPIQAVRDLVRESDYESYLRDACKDLKTADRRIQNVWELVDWLAKSAQGEPGEEVKLADLVARLVLRDMLDRNDEAGEDDQVHLMTLHAAKGLEFNHVYLAGMEEDLLPHRSSIEAGTLEEERRLAYVGITRARRQLTLTMARARKRFNERIGCEPSRFLAELPADDLVWIGGPNATATPADRQEKGRAALGGLRDFLAG